MKFHTTFKDIVVAIIMLLSCAAVVLWAMAYIGMPNPSDVFATKIIDRLAGEEGLSIEIGSVGRNYLKELALADLELSYKGKPLGQIKEVRVPGGIPNLLFALAMPRHAVRIQTKDITLQLTQEQLEDLLVAQRTESPRLLSFGFILELIDADLDVLLEDGTIILRKSDFEVDFRTGVDALHIAGTAKEVCADFSDMNASVSDVIFGLDSIDRIVLEAQHFKGNAFGGSATCEQLVAVLEELSTLSLSLQNLSAEHPQLEASISQLSLSAMGSFSALDSVLLTVASFVGSGPSWSVAAPTTTAHMRFVGWSPRSLSVHTHAELPIFFAFDPYGSFSARELALQLHQSADNALSGWVSLAEGSDNTYLAAEDIMVSLAGRVTDTLQLSLGVRGDVGVTIPEVDIAFSSPLHGELSYQQEEGTLTAELTLPAVESSLINRPLALSLSMQGRENRAQLEGALFLEQEFDLRSVINIDTEESSVILGARLDGLHAQNFSPIIDRWAPFLKPYIREQTTFNGNISIDAAIANSIPTGRVSTDLALLDAQIGTQDLDAGFTFLGMLQGEQIVVPTLTLASGGYRLSFAGETEMNYWLPRGELNFHRIEDGQLLASASMLDLPPDAYEVTLVTTGEKQVQAEALVERVEPALLAGDVQLYYQEDSTALSFSAALDTLDIEFTQDTRLHLALSLAYPQTLSVQANQFQVLGVTSLFSGDLNASFLDLHNWSIIASSLLVENLPYGGQSYTLSFPFAATAQKIDAPRIILNTPSAIYEGSLAYAGAPVTTLAAKNFIAPYELLVRLDELILVSLASDEDTLQAVVQVDSFPLGEFGFLGEDSYLTLSLIGETNLDDQVAIDASLSYADIKSSLQSEFSAIDDTFTVSHLDYTRGNLNIHAESMQFVDGILSLQGNFDHLRILPHIDQDTHISISLVADLGRMQTIFELPKAIQRARSHGFTATVTLEDLLLFGEGGIAGGTYSVSWDKRVGRVDSELFTFSFEPATGHISAHADREFGIGFTLDGSVAEADFGLHLSEIYFSLPMLNRTFIKPIFLFYTGIAEGEIFLGGTPQAPRPYGQLYVNSSEMFVWWLPDDIIEMRGISVSIDGDRATSSYIPFFSTNTRTNQTAQGYGLLSAHFDGLNLEHYEIHIDNLDKPVYVWLPMGGFDADIRGYGIGTFNLFGIGYQTWLDGELTISDLSMTLGIKGIPFWFVPTYLTSTTFKVTTGKGVSFFYPNTPNPIIRATLTENQQFSFSYDHLTDQFEIDGDFVFRSGELYYFQKNFFITEGHMQLHTDALSELPTIKPRINLRAKVSDFDALGNRVDIFLVLRDSTLTNLNPQFESIPAKEVNEIMEILGQSILPTGAYGEIGLYSVASLAAAATDVAERLGYLELSQTTQLTETIRLSLGLDMFSIRSNIVQNILFDALPTSGVMGTLSPIARYLDNTSIFMGKYIGTNFFLQTLVHLSAMQRSKVSTSFLSPDLSLDLELSLDWENPLATISFITQPSELSFTNFLDTMGFSVTKRIVLR